MEEEEEEEGLVEVEEEEGEEVASVVDLVSLSLLTEKMYSLKIGWIKKIFTAPIQPPFKECCQFCGCVPAGDDEEGGGGRGGRGGFGRRGGRGGGGGGFGSGGFGEFLPCF